MSLLVVSRNSRYLRIQIPDQRLSQVNDSAVNRTSRWWLVFRAHSYVYSGFVGLNNEIINCPLAYQILSPSLCRLLWREPQNTYRFDSLQTQKFLSDRAIWAPKLWHVPTPPPFSHSTHSYTHLDPSSLGWHLPSRDVARYSSPYVPYMSRSFPLNPLLLIPRSLSNWLMSDFDIVLNLFWSFQLTPLSSQLYISCDK
jgi:hypothetical protein